MPASSPVVPVSITCRAGKAGAAASRGIVTGSRSMIRLACSSPTAWETVFHILFSILPLPFCIVSMRFPEHSLFGPTGQAGRLLLDKLPGAARIR